jgi:hypothetical protein
VRRAEKDRNQADTIGLQFAADLGPIFFGDDEMAVLRHERSNFVGHAAAEVFGTGAEGHYGDLRAFAQEPPEQ